MSILFYYSLLLSGALLLMWGACRTIRGRSLVLGRGAILSAIGLAVLASALPILLAKPVEIVVDTDFGRPLAVIADTGERDQPRYSDPRILLVEAAVQGIYNRCGCQPATFVSHHCAHRTDHHSK